MVVNVLHWSKETTESVDVSERNRKGNITVLPSASLLYSSQNIFLLATYWSMPVHKVMIGDCRSKQMLLGQEASVVIASVMIVGKEGLLGNRGGLDWNDGH